MSIQRTTAPEGFHTAYSDLPDVRLHYVEGGAGPPVVLLPGYIDTWYSFRLVLPQLAAHGRCLALDQRGYGASTYAGEDYTLDALAGDVVAFLRHRDMEQVTLLGHSMGSFVARKVAMRCPGRIERLVLVSAGLRTDSHPGLAELQAAIAPFQTAIPRAVVAQLVDSVVQPGTVPDWFIARCVDAGARVPARVWQGVLAGLRADNHSDQLGQIIQPTLLIGGAVDRTFNQTEQAALARALPHGRLQVYGNVGHYPHWEQPARFVKDVAGFLREPAAHEAVVAR